MPITVMMDHVVAESKAAYKGTEHENTFFIFHDALSQWWEDEAQDYLSTIFDVSRQLRCCGLTNLETRFSPPPPPTHTHALTHKNPSIRAQTGPYQSASVHQHNHNCRYARKLVGDSPELCRALDAYGFADLENALTHNCAISSVYPVGDPRRFGLGTPKEVWSSMVRCWSIAPTGARVVEDISPFLDVLDKIIDHEGSYVPDLILRHGRRTVKRDNGDPLKNKRRARQRIAMIEAKPLHPDSKDAYYALLNGDCLKMIEEEIDNDEEDDGVNHADDSDSEEEEEEEEFTTPVASPPSSHNSIFLPSAPLSLAPPTHLVEGRAQEAQVERPRAARVVGLMNEGMSSGMDEPPAGMQRSVSGIVLQSVLQSAHGGVWYVLLLCV